MRAWREGGPSWGTRRREAWPPCARRASSSTPANDRGHDHADGEPHDHAHPHQHSDPGEPPFIGIVGAGAVGSALGVALTRAGWPITAVASRDPVRRERFKELVGGHPGVRRGHAAPRRGGADHPGRAGRRDRAARPRASGCTAGRRWSTPAARSARRSSSRRWRPGPRSAGSIRWSRSPTRIGPSRRSTARRSPSRATTSSSPCSATWPTAIGAHAGPPGARDEGGLSRRGGPRRRRLRRPARRDRRARPGRRSRRDRRAGDLRPAHRADPRQRPGARHPAPPSPGR